MQVAPSRSLPVPPPGAGPGSRRSPCVWAVTHGAAPGPRPQPVPAAPMGPPGAGQVSGWSRSRSGPAAMEPVGTWGPAQAAAWLRGLDGAVQGYPFEAWGLAGPELLGLGAEALEALGVRSLGHQELLLEAVEQLRALEAGLGGTSLRTLTRRLRDLAQGTRSLVLGGLQAGAAPRPPSLTLLARVVDLVRAAKGLFCWLNRYLFSTLNDFSASQDIVVLCAQLAETLQADCPAAKRDTRILQIGLSITSTTSCLHFVSAATSEALAAHRGLILPGDEIVQVNEQTVVGWTRVNLAKKLLENRSRVTLVLKKIPLDPPSSPPPPRQQLLEPFVDAAESSSTRSSEGSPMSLTPSAADFDSGPDSALDPVTDEEAGEDKSLRLPREAVGQLAALPCYGAAEEVVQERGSPPGTPAAELSPMAAPADGAGGAELSPMAAPVHGAGGAELSQHRQEGSTQRGRRPKGVATRLSRRRVSCRDLGRVDCDGWLLKKKEHVGFMAHKWKRCWFVLKGHTLYWYHHPNDEKAAGLLNVATYDLESTREQKKKYVFQLCHQRYKPFIFAAETLADLSMWVSHLITAKTKHTLAHQLVPDREEDCYSETEAEDPDDESPRPGCDLPGKRLQNTPDKAPLPPACSEPSSPQPCASTEPSGEDLECLMRSLKQGGVSLMGRQLTQEQYRRSFIRRSKNPLINAKVHAVRALQSTLKAKLLELQALEQLLSDAALTSESFSRWKQEHQELYQELREAWTRRQGQDQDMGLGAERGLPQEGAEP